jgi:hypothetical protein
VVAPNAGLAAYLSWLPTLQHLGHAMHGGSSTVGAGLVGGTGSAAPLLCCFTDFNEEAVHRARQLCAHVLAGCGGVGDPDGGGSRGTEQQQAEGLGSSSGDPPGSCSAGVAAASSALVLKSGMNPFRRPAAVLSADHALPSAGNAFTLWLLRHQDAQQRLH